MGWRWPSGWSLWFDVTDSSVADNRRPWWERVTAYIGIKKHF